ncbi:MAG: YchF family ATPase [Planctomycetota bacterium]|nr:YchF family ATPase [Planctomycetota bacterium]
MKLGITGFPACGKTSLFNAITGARLPVGQYSSSPGLVSATMKVPDERLKRIWSMYEGSRLVYAAVECVDFTGLISGKRGEGSGKEIIGEILGKLRQVDAIVHVVRAFEDPGVPHVLGSVDPMRDLEETNGELLFADLVQCENRIAKLKVQVTKPTKTQEQDRKELATLEKVYAILESGRPAREFVPHTEEERRHVAAFQFLTMKKQVVVFNVDENDIGPGGKGENLEKQVPGSLALCAKLEMEIAQLPEEERSEYMKVMGIKEAVAGRLARQAYAALDALSFFTVGFDEVRAWTVRRGDTALDAAAKVHTDLARGFVRAEVFRCEDLIAAGSEKALKAAGKIRLEGKEYQIRDGDVIFIRANTR